MKEKGKGLNSRLQQAERQRGNQIASHCIGDAGRYSDMNHVEARRDNLGL